MGHPSIAVGSLVMSDNKYYVNFAKPPANPAPSRLLPAF